MVERVGQEPGQGPGGGAVVAAEQRPGRRGQPAAAGQAQRLRLAQRQVEHEVAQPPAAPGRPPDEQRDGARAARRAAGRGLGEQVEDAAPVGGGRRALEVGAEGGQHAVAVVAAADQPGQPRQLQPGAGQHGPAVLGRLGQPGVVARRRDPVRVDARGLVDQPGARGDLDEQGRDRLGDVEVLRGPAQVADAEPAGPQHRRRVDRPRLEQRLDVGDGVGGGQRGGAVDLAGAGRAQLQRGRRRRHRPERGVAAQRQPDLARQLDGAEVDGHEQPAGEQPADRAVGVGGARGAQRVADLAERRAGGEGVEHLAGARVDGREQGRQARRVLEDLEHATEAGVGGQAQGLRDAGELAVGAARQAGRDGSAQPRGRRADHLAQRPDQVQRVVLAPHEREAAQPLHGGDDGAPREGAPDRRLHRREGSGVLGEHERVHDGQGGGVELLQRPQHREADAGAGGEHAEVGRDGRGEVGAGPQQRRQPVVGPGAEPVREAAGSGAHPRGR